jgi:SpoIID/LytB domain protein
MPLGKKEENFEALKALAICIRTYAVKKMKDGKIYFDLYADTRDQVYAGADAESPLSNKAVEETKSMILKYKGSQAIIFYHSTCGEKQNHPRMCLQKMFLFEGLKMVLNHIVKFHHDMNGRKHTAENY